MPEWKIIIVYINGFFNIGGNINTLIFELIKSNSLSYYKFMYTNSSIDNKIFGFNDLLLNCINFHSFSHKQNNKSILLSIVILLIDIILFDNLIINGS